MFARGIVAAMEDELSNQELAIDEAGADSMEADLVETVDMAADIDAGTNEMEQTVKDADQLERHVEVLTDAEGEGGASPELIESTEIAVEAIYARLGITGSTGIPACESFATKGNRKRYTTEAIDSIKSKLKSIWEAVKGAFQKLITFVKNFFAKLFDANAKMLARVNTIKQKAKSVKGSPAEKISSSGITTVIARDDVKKVNFNGLKETFDVAKAMSEESSALMDGLVSESKFDSYVCMHGLTNGKAIEGVTAPEGYHWDELLSIGSSKIGILVRKQQLKGKEAYEATKKLSVTVKKIEAKAGEDLAGLTADEAVKIASDIEVTVNSLLEKKAMVATIEANLNKTLAAINSAASSASKEDEGFANRANHVRYAVIADGNTCSSLVTKAAAETTRACQAYLTYAERSIAGYGEKDDKDKK